MGAEGDYRATMRSRNRRRRRWRSSGKGLLYSGIPDLEARALGKLLLTSGLKSLSTRLHMLFMAIASVTYRAVAF